MLVAAFLLLWVAMIVAGLAAYAVRPQSSGAPWPRWTMPAIAFSALALGVGLPAMAVIYSSGEREHSSRGGLVLTDQQVAGRAIFASACKRCHTLDDAAAAATIGPNLDVLRPDYDTVIDAVTNGRARGRGQMPAGLVDDQGARAVAAYVAGVTADAVEAETPKK